MPSALSRFTLAAALFCAAGVAAQQPPAQVRATAVVSEPAQEMHRVLGTLRAVSRAEIAAREAGAVIEVPFREGDPVKAGDLLAKFDASRIHALLAEARSDRTALETAIRRRQAELERAKTNYDMQMRLYENRTLAQRERLDAIRDLDVAEAQLDEARHALEQAESRIRLFEVRLADTEIRAPFDGSMVGRHIEVGEWVEPGDPVATVVSNDLEAVLAVPERLASAVADHAHEVDFSITATGRAIRSNSVSKVADVDPRSRTFPVIVRIDGSDPSLTAGMSVTARIPAGKRAERLIVPKDAIVRSGPGAAHVFRVNDADGVPVAQQVPVDVLFEMAETAAVDAATLAPGDLVVVEGNERLTPNRALAVIADDAAITMRVPPESTEE